jgi:2-keto-3-deoxy-L-rhamnonate aldolase RhmA
MSYGYRDGPAHDEVQAAIARAEQAIAASPVHLGGLALSGEIANAMIADGISTMNGSSRALTVPGATC